MRNIQDTFETRKRSFLRAFLICVTVSLTIEGTSDSGPGWNEELTIDHHHFFILDSWTLERGLRINWMTNSSNSGLGRPFLATVFKFIRPFIGVFVHTMGGMGRSVERKFFFCTLERYEKTQPLDKWPVCSHTLWSLKNLAFFPNNFIFQHWLIP